MASEETRHDEDQPTKWDRRRALRARRREIAASRDLAADGERLARTALDLIAERTDGADPGARGRLTITLYEPLPVEPDVSTLLHEAYRRGVRVLVPITLADLDLDWAEWTPEGNGAPLGNDAIGLADIVFTPGLSVDAVGTRMGQGGGCYDKALPRAAAAAPVVCILHPGEDQTDPPLPREAHDVPVDAVLTGDGLRWVTAAR